MPPTADLTWNGRRLTLDADRAALARDNGDLLVADVHLGKAAAFRAGASPVPEAVTGADLDRLSALIRRHAPRRLVALGDLLHAPEAHSPATLDALRRWRARHRDLPILLVRGNHDARAGDPPADLDVECVDAPHALAGFELAHEPPEDDARPTIAGHVHPGVRLSGGVHALRAPCFWACPRLLVLPAFGAFTGCETIRPRAGDRVFAVGAGSVLEVGPRPAVSSAR